MERIIDRLNKYMSFNNLNDNQVTVKCNLSVGLLGKARRGKSDLGKKAIDKILSCFQDLNGVWLLTGEGEMLKASNEKYEDSNNELEISDYIGGYNQPNNNPNNPVAMQLIEKLTGVIERQSKQIDDLIEEVKVSGKRVDLALRIIEHNQGNSGAQKKETA